MTTRSHGPATRSPQSGTSLVFRDRAGGASSLAWLWCSFRPSHSRVELGRTGQRVLRHHSRSLSAWACSKFRVGYSGMLECLSCSHSLRAAKAPKHNNRADGGGRTGSTTAHSAAACHAHWFAELLDSNNLDLSLLTLHSSRLEFLFSFRAHASCDGSPFLARREALCLRVYAPTSVRT